jgi:hypothetical protein
MKAAEIAIIVAVFLSLFLIIGLPIILSAVTDVPYSFLTPFPLSVLPTAKTMSVKINQTAPTTTGEELLLTVLDAGNKTPIEDASVKILLNGNNVWNTTTGSDGTAHFPFMGTTTIVYVSKDGYQDAEPIPLPRIPESWVTIRDYQFVTWGLGLLGSWGPALFLYGKQRGKVPSRRKSK